VSETQGRGSYFDDERIERAAKYAKESGGDEASIRSAAKRHLDGTQAAIDAVREKLRRLLGK
jgi:hypothetical protein